MVEVNKRPILVGQAVLLHRAALLQIDGKHYWFQPFIHNVVKPLFGLSGSKTLVSAFVDGSTKRGELGASATYFRAPPCRSPC